MNFNNIGMMVIDEGRVRKISHNGAALWCSNRLQEPIDLLPLMTNTWWISTSGSISNRTDPNWLSTDKIPVDDGAIVTFTLAGYVTVANVAAYNASGKVIGYSNYTGSGTALYENVYHVPQGTTHITVTGHAPTYTYGGKQSVTLSYPENIPPRYHEDGLVLWCDGINNAGNGHDNTVTTWKDLTGNGNDLINVASKTATVPAETMQGEWKKDGISVNVQSNQFVRSVQAFDLGIDRTLEMRVSVVADSYAELGFVAGDRYKFRTNGGKGWFVLTATNSTGNITTGSAIPAAPVGQQFTVGITRVYQADKNNTLYTVYYNGLIIGTKLVDGDYREGETSTLLFGNEKDNVTVHSVRLYNRALTAAEVALNYEYDRMRFV